MTHRNMSSNQSHRFRQSDDEEEDLDALRREALKTLHPKTESSNTNQTYSRGSSPTSGAQIQNQMRPTVSQSYGGGIQIQSNTMYRNNGSKSQSYFPPNHSMPPSRMITTYDGRHRHDKLEAVDPYLPQHVKPTAPVMIGGGVPPMMVSNGWMPDGPPSTMHTGLYKPYIQPTIDDPIGIGNVQLSPRSKAFVAKNQYILMRRKGVSSPYSRSPQSPGYYGSPSPPAYRPAADRWSHSPPPKLKSKSRSPVNRGNNRSPRYVRRSHSRSPVNRPRSPVFRRQSLSRSPLAKSRHTSPDNHRRHGTRSPQPQMQPRRMSRSPPHQNARHKFSPRRQTSRSPVNRHSRPVSRSPTNNINGRRRSPIQHPPRYVNKFRRSLSPHPRRLSPIQVHTGGDNRPENNRGRTPPNNMHANHQIHSRRSNSPRRRSFSRSPARKFGRRSRDRVIQNATLAKRRSPFNNAARRRFDAPVNGFRNRLRKRSASPLADRRKKNHRTRSVDRQRREDNRRPMEKFEKRVEDLPRNDRNENRNRDNAPERVLSKPDQPVPDSKGKEKEKVNGASGVSKSPVDNVPVEANTPKDPPRRELKLMEKTEKTERSEKASSKKEDFQQHHSTQHRPEEQDESSENDDDEDDDDNNNDDDDNDGICLFPSDESESENEGRFKLSSKTERDNKVSTVSFTKLGESPPPMVIKELKDFANENRSRSGSKNRSNDRDRDRDRDRERDRDRGGRRNYDKRRDGRFRKFDTNRNRDRVKGISNSGNISSSSSRRDRDDSHRLDDKLKGDKPMFKSTFQAVENEARSNSKGFPEKAKDLNDRKGYSSIKKTYNKDKRDSTDKEPSNEHNLQSAILSVATLSANSSSSSSTSATSATVNNNSNSSNSSPKSGKKPIHLRLGAMTNTFKASKKSSSQSSSSSSSWKATSLEKV